MERADYKNTLKHSKFKIISGNLDTNNPKWQYMVKKSINPEFTEGGMLKFSQNLLPIGVYRKVSRLFDSILNARIVMLRYKSDLATVVDLDNECITPLTASNKIPMLFYKREDLTCIKAYKIRGAIYQMSKIIEQNHSTQLNFVAASTGNHALGVLKSAEILSVPAVTICISESVTDFKRKKLENRVNDLKKRGIDAKLVIEGENFDKTNKYAKDIAENNEDTYYIDPYNTHNAVAGQGTIGLEVLSQLEMQYFDPEKLEFDFEKLDKLKKITVIVPIGGGGLISGIATALLMGVQNFPKFKNLDISIIGVKLNDLNSLYGDAIKVKIPGNHNHDLLKYLITKQIIVNDADMKRGIDFISDDLGSLVEGASSATLKPVFERIIQPSEENAVICILSGGNINF
jgi:threonine dehydratase